MSGARVRGLLASAALFAAFAILASCTVGVGGGGYYGDGYAGVGYVGDYYEPYGYDYGGWGAGYRVGPYRDHDHRGDRGNPGPHSYRPAPTSHATPSIPRGSRSGGSRR